MRPLFLPLLLLLAAVAPSHVAWASAGTDASEFKAFCQTLKSACADTCMEDQRGLVKIVFSCEQSSKEDKYDFGCTCDGDDRTGSALKRVSQPTTSRLTKTSTSTVRKTLSEIETATIKAGTSTKLSTSLSAISSAVTETSFRTSTAVISTASTTQTISTTRTDTFTYVPLVYSTSVAATKTLSSFQPVDTTTFRTLSLDSSPSKRRASGNDVEVHVQRSKRASTFCAAYATSCQNECSIIKSSVKEQTCSKASSSGATTDSYTLNCVCKNGKEESIHALKGLADAIVKEVTLVNTRTSTVRKTSTRSVTIPMITKTSVIKSSITKLHTVTQAVTTTLSVTSTPGTTFTDRDRTLTVAPTSTTTTLATTTTTKAVSTTVQLLAPTGHVRLDLSDGTHDTVALSGIYVYSSDSSDVVRYALMLLPPDGTGVDSYALMNMASPGSTWLAYRSYSDWFNAPDNVNTCTGQYISDHTPYDLSYVPMAFRLGNTAPNSLDPSRVWQVPLTPQLVLENGKSVSPPYYKYDSPFSTTYPLVMGLSFYCDTHPEQATDYNKASLIFEPTPTA